MNIGVLLLDIVGRYGVSWPCVRGLMASIPLTTRRAALGRIGLLQSWRNWHVSCVTLWPTIMGRVHNAEQLAQSTERSRATAPTSSLTWLLIRLTIAIRGDNRSATCI